jgi:hypothetical protein
MHRAKWTTRKSTPVAEKVQVPCALSIEQRRIVLLFGEKYKTYVDSRQPSAVSRQPSAVSRQPSAVSRQPSAVSRQPSIGKIEELLAQSSHSLWKWVG